MGIFTRFKDIISSNISSMLDTAEDPDKLIRLMLREMEETLVELKARCAATMAEATQVRRGLEEAGQARALWERRAELALRARREDMAQEAASERLAAQKRVDALEREVRGFDELVDRCRRDIALLEERIVGTRDKQRLMSERRQHARTRRQAREQVRAADALDAMHRFEDLEQRISRMEYEAELAYTARTANADFKDLEHNADIAATLDEIRARIDKTANA